MGPPHPESLLVRPFNLKTKLKLESGGSGESGGQGRSVWLSLSFPPSQVPPSSSFRVKFSDGHGHGGSDQPEGGRRPRLHERGGAGSKKLYQTRENENAVFLESIFTD
jgi:hypothetical protein